MSVAARAGGQTTLVEAGAVLSALAVLSVTVAAGRGVEVAAGATLVVAVFAAAHRFLTRWQVLAGAIVFVIMFIPIKRYQFGAALPFDLEPYRIAVALVVAIWIASLLVDTRVRLRRTLLDGPLLLFLAAVLGSILTNVPRITEGTFIRSTGLTTDLSSDVLKKVLFLLSFYLFFYFLVSIARQPQTIIAIVKTLAGTAAIVAFFGIVEARTGYNVFNDLGAVLPGLEFQGALTEEGIARGGRLRVYASAQHPIALATMFVMVLPLAVYVAYHTGHKRWMLASAVLAIGAVSTVSRTSITTLVVVALVLFWLRPVMVKRLLPLVVPAVVVIHLALPGAIGGLQGAFFPSQGLIEDQTVYAGRLSSRRVGPEFEKIKENPLFGQGYGTRISEGPRQNAKVLDNDWLGTASETGLVGFGAWVWFFARFIRRAGLESKRDYSPRGLLLAAVTASATAFAVSMVTLDAFYFIQVTFVLFIIAALGVATLATTGPWPSGRREGAAAAARLGHPTGQAS